MKFRRHRGSLDDSLQTIVEIGSRDELAQHLRQTGALFSGPITGQSLEIKPYGFDPRIGWETYIVTIPGQGVIGFTDGPL